MFLARLAHEGVCAAMSDKVVLPRFDLPRDESQRAFRLLWFTVGLVVLGVFGLGAAVWRHQKLEEADAARVAALLNPPPPPPSPHPAAAVPSPAASSAGVVAVAAQPDNGAHNPAGKGESETAATRKLRHHGASKLHGKALAKSGSPKVASKSGSKKEDPIDKLLSQMK